MKTLVGKIQYARFGRGGTEDAMIGFYVEIVGEGWIYKDFWGFWRTPRRATSAWSEQDRINKLGSIVLRVNDVLLLAGRSAVEKLAGTRVEVTLGNGDSLQSWRVIPPAPAATFAWRAPKRPGRGVIA